MSEETSPTRSASEEVLRAIWQVDPTAATEIDELTGEAAVCRNMVGVSFEAMVEQGTDLRTAWRAQLAREGKLDTSAGTIGDLVSGAVSGAVPDAGRGQSPR